MFEKTKTKNKEGQDEEKWKQSAPAARDVDQTTVDNLVSAITAARATSFVDSAAKTGLDKPELDRSRSSRTKASAWRRSRSRGAAPTATRARDGEPGAAKVDAATIDNIVKSLEGIK